METASYDGEMDEDTNDADLDYDEEQTKGSYDNNDNDDTDPPKRKVCGCYNNVLTFHRNIVNTIDQFFCKHLLCPLVKISVTHPITTIIAAILISILLPFIAYFTDSINYVTDTIEFELWTPLNSPYRATSSYIKNVGFNPFPSPTLFTIHANDNNILSYGGISKVYDVVNIITNSPYYQTVCGGSTTNNSSDLKSTSRISSSSSSNNNNNNDNECYFSSITDFWKDEDDFNNEFANISSLLYENQYASNNNISRNSNNNGTIEEELIDIANSIISDKISSLTFNDGSPVVRDMILTVPSNMTDETQIQYVTSYKGVLLLPTNNPYTNELELDLYTKLATLNEQWKNDDGGNSNYRVVTFNFEATQMEYERALNGDSMLVIIALCIMIIFTSIVFMRYKKYGTDGKYILVNSSGILGIGSIVTVTLSILSGYGLCLLCQVPITPITQTIPFLAYGIGLDDSFILMGALNKNRNKQLPIIDRICSAIEEVGMSITTTTITNVAVFAIGATTVVPAIRWLCIYASVIILVDFLYQVTFFLALVIIDEKRTKANRLDFLCCLKAPPNNNNNTGVDGTISIIDIRKDGERPTTMDGRLMNWYTSILFHPIVKIIVLLGFATLFTLACISASTAEQGFDLTTNSMPGSPIREYYEVEKRYGTSKGVVSVNDAIYFVDIDVTDPTVQKAMYQYIDDLVSQNEYIQDPPEHFWLQDFQSYMKLQTLSSSFGIAADSKTNPQNMTFNDHLDKFLNIDIFAKLYKDMIVRDPVSGTVIASRVPFAYSMQLTSALDQKKAYISQKEITKAQPLNDVHYNKNLPGNIFTYGNMYGLYAYYETVTRSMVRSMVLCLVAVGIITLLTLPHPGGTLLAVACTGMVYIEMIGLLPVAGFMIDPVTTLLLLLGIGFVIDYCIHIIHAYLHAPISEKNGDSNNQLSRDDRARYALSNIGVSVLLGGTSTFLGLCVLGFSNSDLFWTFFVMLSSTVALGLVHALILMPVLLSLIGPVSTEKKKKSVATTPETNDYDKHIEGEKTLSHDKYSLRASKSDNLSVVYSF